MSWAIWVIASLCSGYLLMKSGGGRRELRTLVWGVPVLAVWLGYLSVRQAAPGFAMLVLILLLFLGMKNVVVVYRYRGQGRLNLGQWLCFALGWPGMDPLPFERLGEKRAFNKAYLYSGLLSLFAGCCLLYLLAWLLRYTALPAYVLCLCSFVPFVLIFHMGFFTIVAALWERAGVVTGTLMDAPWKAESLSSFWGKRWNVAFIQMTRTCLFVPMARKGRAPFALALSFAVSGIFHEVALTLPAHGGYGMPLLYFVLQFVLVHIEKRFRHRWSRPAQKLWIWAALLVPFPLLFPPPFLCKVILPLLQGLS